MSSKAKSISWDSPFKNWSYLKVQNLEDDSQFDSFRSSLADWKIYIATFLLSLKTVGSGLAIKLVGTEEDKNNIENMASSLYLINKNKHCSKLYIVSRRISFITKFLFIF